MYNTGIPSFGRLEGGMYTTVINLSGRLGGGMYTTVIYSSGRLGGRHVHHCYTPLREAKREAYTPPLLTPQEG